MIHPARLLQRLFYGISKCYWGMRFSDGSPATSVADALSMFCFSEVFQDNEASVAASPQWANDDKSVIKPDVKDSSSLQSQADMDKLDALSPDNWHERITAHTLRAHIIVENKQYVMQALGEQQGIPVVNMEVLYSIPFDPKQEHGSVTKVEFCPTEYVLYIWMNTKEMCHIELETKEITWKTTTLEDDAKGDEDAKVVPISPGIMSTLVTSTVSLSPWQHVSCSTGKTELIEDFREDVQHIWGCNAADDIFYRNGVSGTWQQVEGKLKQIMVSEDGSFVIGVNAENKIYWRQGAGWPKYPFQVKGVDESVQWQYEWTQLDGKLKYVSCSRGGEHLWGCNADDDIFYRNGFLGKATWQQVEGGKLKQVMVSEDGSFVIGINAENDIFWRQGLGDHSGPWTQLEGKLKKIGACTTKKSGDRQIWGVGMNDDIYYGTLVGSVQNKSIQWQKWQKVKGKLRQMISFIGVMVRDTDFDIVDGWKKVYRNSETEKRNQKFMVRVLEKENYILYFNLQG